MRAWFLAFRLYEHNPIPGVTQPGTVQWLNPNAFVSAVDPSTGACTGGDSAAELPVRRSRPECSARSRFRLERFVSDQVVPVERTREAAHRRPVLQCLQSPELRSSGGLRGNSGQPVHADRIRFAARQTLAADPACWGSGWAATVRPRGVVLRLGRLELLKVDGNPGTRPSGRWLPKLLSRPEAPLFVLLR